MPELPDVEVFKRYLDATALNQKIARVSVKNRRVLRRYLGLRMDKKPREVVRERPKA
jgi:formamidopyrimidine-DNA glycosylase